MMNCLKPGFYAGAFLVVLLVAAVWFQVSPGLSGDKICAPKSLAASAQTGFRAEGTVFDDSGELASGVKVYAIRETMESPRVWRTSDTCITDKQGKFVFKSLPWLVKQREYVLVAYMPGKYIGQASSRIYANIGFRGQRTADTGLVIRLHNLETFAGRVVDQKGRGLGGVKVRASRMITDNQFINCEALPSGKIPEAVSDTSGNYRLTGVPNGFRLLAIAEKPGYVQYPRLYDSDPKRIVMQQSARVRGRLVDKNGKSIPGADIWADAEKFDGYGRTKTDKRGEYEFDLYPAGKYSISALEMKGHIAKSLRNLQVVTGKTVKAPDLVAMPTVLLRGKVIGQVETEPIRGFVNLRPISYHSANVTSSRLDSRNGYEVAVLPGETYKIEYHGAGPYSLNGRSSTLRIADRGASFDLKLQKTRTAAGYAVNQHGLPISGAVIRLPEYGAQTAAGALYGYAVTGKDGSYEIGINPRLAEAKDGQVLVQAYHNQRHLVLSESIEIKSFLQSKPKLKLQPAKTLKVSVLGSGNRPETGVAVYINPDLPGGGSIETDNQGTAIFDVCPGVKYHLTADNRYARKRYPETGKISTTDKSWNSEVTIKLR